MKKLKIRRNLKKRNSREEIEMERKEENLKRQKENK